MTTIENVICDGFSIGYRLAPGVDGTFRITILIQRLGTDAEHVEWNPPAQPGFIDETVAVRYAHYMLMRIAGVDRNGKPTFE